MKAVISTVAAMFAGSAIGAAGAWYFTRSAGGESLDAPSVEPQSRSEPFVEPRVQGPADDADPFAGLEGVTAGNHTATPGVALDALAELAGRDPEAAFARAQSIANTRLREIALARVAEVWVTQDLSGVLAALARLSEASERLAFSGALYTTLARIDPEAALAEAAALPRDALAVIAALDPAGVRAAIEQTPDQALRDRLGHALARSLAEWDAAAAAQIAETLTPSIDTQFLFRDIARLYAARDPDGALAWAATIGDGPSAQLISAIFGRIAVDDLGRAVELALGSSLAQFNLSSQFNISRGSTGFANVSTAVLRNLDRMPAVIERLRASDHARARAAVESAMESWALADPDGAMDWLLARGANVPPEQLAALAAGFSQNDVGMTAAAVDLMPPANRGEWISEVAAAYMQRDADAALDWLSRYRSDPRYGAWVSAAARRMAADSVLRFDPAPAIRLLSTTDRPDPTAVSRIVPSWASEEPIAAAEWVLALRDPAARAAGAAATVTGWAGGDIDAASRWAFGLPAGEVRDAALGPLVTRTITDGTIDARTVRAYSSDASRTAALVEALPGLSFLARSDPARARAIADAFYGTPELQQRAERAMAGDLLPR